MFIAIAVVLFAMCAGMYYIGRIMELISPKGRNFKAPILSSYETLPMQFKKSKNGRVFKDEYIQ